MARLYGSMTNSRHNEVTASNPGYAHIRGWRAGVNVVPFRESETGRDAFRVYMTSGSNGSMSDVLVGIVYDLPEGPAWDAAEVHPSHQKARPEAAEAPDTEICDECGAEVPASGPLLSTDHEEWCSLYSVAS